MKLNNSKLYLFALALGSILWACNEDPDDPSNPSGPSTQPQTEVAIENLLNGSITTTLNPSGVAPLTAELTFSTQGNTEVEITVLGKVPVSNKFDMISSSHAIPILGLYADTMNSVVLKISNKLAYAYDTIKIQTDSLPAALPTVEIVTANPFMMEEGMNLNCLSVTNGTRFEGMPMIYDHMGDIRWFLDLRGKYPNAGFISPWEPIDNGRLLTEVGDQVIEFDMLGYEAKVIPLPAGYESHHDVIKLPNGNYAVAVNKASSTMPWTDTSGTQNRQTVEDILIEISPSGTILQEWDLKNLLDVDREVIQGSLTSYGAVDWFHMNAVEYSESDDTYILSGRHQGVVKVDRQGKLVWIIAPKKFWGNAGIDGNGYSTDSLLLTAVDGNGTPYSNDIQNGDANDPNFDWPWGQHAPVVLPNGNIAIFDNGCNRTFTRPTPMVMPNYSRYVEYKVNESNMTIQQVHEYGSARGTETFSWIISDVDYLPNTGNVLFLPGVSDGFSTSRMVELTRPGMMPVFEGKLTFKTILNPPLTFGQLDINYRAERVKLYR